jgi:Flp pilus assembly protein TadG
MADDKRQDYRERGAELVEFALVLPLLLLIVLGTIEFGRAYYTYHLLSKGLRDGARYAATSRLRSDGTWVSTDSPSVTSRTQNVVVYGKPTLSGSEPKIIPDLTTAQITVTPSAIPSGSTDLYVTVAAAYPYQPLFSLIIPTTITLGPSVRMFFIGQKVFSI